MNRSIAAQLVLVVAAVQIVLVMAGTVDRPKDRRRPFFFSFGQKVDGFHAPVTTFFDRNRRTNQQPVIAVKKSEPAVLPDTTNLETSSSSSDIDKPLQEHPEVQDVDKPPLLDTGVESNDDDIHDGFPPFFVQPPELARFSSIEHHVGMEGEDAENAEEDTDPTPPKFLPFLLQGAPILPESGQSPPFTQENSRKFSNSQIRQGFNIPGELDNVPAQYPQSDAADVQPEIPFGFFPPKFLGRDQPIPVDDAIEDDADEASDKDVQPEIAFGFFPPTFLGRDQPIPVDDAVEDDADEASDEDVQPEIPFGFFPPTYLGRDQPIPVDVAVEDDADEASDEDQRAVVDENTQDMSVEENQGVPLAFLPPGFAPTFPINEESSDDDIIYNGPESIQPNISPAFLPPELSVTFSETAGDINDSSDEESKQESKIADEDEIDPPFDASNFASPPDVSEPALISNDQEPPIINFGSLPLPEDENDDADDVARNERLPPVGLPQLFPNNDSGRKAQQLAPFDNVPPLLAREDTADNSDDKDAIIPPVDLFSISNNNANSDKSNNERNSFSPSSFVSPDFGLNARGPPPGGPQRQSARGSTGALPGLNSGPPGISGNNFNVDPRLQFSRPPNGNQFPNVPSEFGRGPTSFSPQSTFPQDRSQRNQQANFFRGFPPQTVQNNNGPRQGGFFIGPENAENQPRFNPVIRDQVRRSRFQGQVPSGLKQNGRQISGITIQTPGTPAGIQLRQRNGPPPFFLLPRRAIRPGQTRVPQIPQNTDITGQATPSGSGTGRSDSIPAVGITYQQPHIPAQSSRFEYPGGSVRRLSPSNLPRQFPPGVDRYPSSSGLDAPEGDYQYGDDDFSGQDESAFPFARSPEGQRFVGPQGDVTPVSLIVPTHNGQFERRIVLIPNNRRIPYQTPSQNPESFDPRYEPEPGYLPGPQFGNGRGEYIPPSVDPRYGGPDLDDNENVKTTSYSNKRRSRCTLPKTNSTSGVPHFQFCTYYSSRDSNREPRFITRTTRTYIPLPHEIAYRRPLTSLTERYAKSRSPGFSRGGLVQKYPNNHSQHSSINSRASRDRIVPFQFTIPSDRRQISFFDRLFSTDRNVLGAVSLRRSPIRHLRISSLASQQQPRPNFKYSATVVSPSTSRRHAFGQF